MKKSLYLLSLLCISSALLAMEIKEPEQLQQLPEKPAQALRIMTYNIRRAGPEEKDEQQWSNRLPLVERVIKRINPDFMGLQEVTNQQLADLKEAFPNLKFFGKSRGSSWGGWGADEYNPIFYDADKVTLLCERTFSINESQSIFGWTPLEATQTGWLPRICTFGKFKDNKTDREFYIYNTHLDNKYQQARINGLTTIKKMITKGKSDVPIIITADFNAQFEGQLQEVLPSFKLARDASEYTYGPYDTQTGWNNDKLKSIDHLLVNDAQRVSVINYTVVANKTDEHPSDHLPVFADIVL